MKPQRSRSRNKNNRSRSGPQGGNVVNRVFDSSGPEGKVRGTPQQVIEKYNQLARDAMLSNDRVAMENFQQHAEHYLRLLSEAQKEQDAKREEQERQNRERQAERDRDRTERQERDSSQKPHDQPSHDQPARDHPAQDQQPDVEVHPSDDAEASTLVDTPESKPKTRRAPRRKPKPKPEGDGGDDAPKGGDDERKGGGDQPEAAE